MSSIITTSTGIEETPQSNARSLSLSQSTIELKIFATLMKPIFLFNTCDRRFDSLYNELSNYRIDSESDSAPSELKPLCPAIYNAEKLTITGLRLHFTDSLNASTLLALQKFFRM